MISIDKATNSESYFFIAGYNYINPDWNEIVKEFNALEVYYGELEQRAMQNSDGCKYLNSIFLFV